MNSFTNWDTELYHYGVPGMKWGTRKYINRDGSLTKKAEKEYGESSNKSFSGKKAAKILNKQSVVMQSKAVKLDNAYSKAVRAEKAAQRKSTNKKEKKATKAWKKYDNLQTVMDSLDRFGDMVISKGYASGYELKPKKGKKKVAWNGNRFVKTNAPQISFNRR